MQVRTYEVPKHGLLEIAVPSGKYLISASGKVKLTLKDNGGNPLFIRFVLAHDAAEIIGGKGRMLKVESFETVPFSLYVNE